MDSSKVFNKLVEIISREDATARGDGTMYFIKSNSDIFDEIIVLYNHERNLENRIARVEFNYMNVRLSLTDTLTLIEILDNKINMSKITKSATSEQQFYKL